MSPFITLSLLLVGAVLVLIAAVVLMMARMLLSPARMTDAKAAYLLKRLSPGDLGLHFQRLEFTVRDAATQKDLKLAAWWIPHPAAMGKCAVLIHGYGDAKVGAIAWAPLFHSLGYHILAPDLRAHGESDGRHTTAGFFERHDLNQMLDQLRAARPTDTSTLILFGISLGAAVALAAAESRDDIAAIVLECPYTEYSHAVRAHAAALNMPAPSLVPTVLKLAQRTSGARFDEVRPIDLIPQIKCPVMVISGECDPFAPPDDLIALERAVARRNDSRSIFWKVSSAAHVLCIAPDPDDYRARVESFLKSLPGAAKSPALQGRDSSRG
jgi:pimeloyl-ACP methyl ester carboxylesterase